ncbi:WD40 repeat-like protein [Armillaria gallica]|uniref:Elongator complex protein 2 n=1 Tax=Armillaria gallica TaxID=47427 RepID=A0A2H3EV13_ARMGA|nr:WD40 repeat-like protein [Armillaria gallica]
MSVSTAYIAASTNRFCQAADASSTSLIAFGSANLVCLWDIAADPDPGPYQTLPGHEGTVTSVKFISDDSFITADDKGVVMYWRRDGSHDQVWSIFWRSSKVQAHSKAVSSLCVHHECLATGSSDSSVKIWKIGTDEVVEVQSMSLKGKYPLSIALSFLPQSESLILAIACTDRNIQIWTRSDGTASPFYPVLSGHDDWARCLAFRPSLQESEPLVLASGSHDTTIRLWNIEPYKRATEKSSVTSTDALSDELLDAFEASLGELADAEEGGRQISLKRHILTVKTSASSSQQFTITFDALLVGHEAGVTSLNWRPATSSSSMATLLSSSTDSSVILWSPSTVLASSNDTSTTIWINRQRFGDIGGQRLGGFVGGLWGKDGSEAFAWGWSGGWRRWRCSADEKETWTEVHAINGHSGPVRGICWSPNGQFLISAGLDQTTRIHGPITHQNGRTTWHELARPQVHGYDLLGVSFLDNLKFVSIADEKVARVFEAPRSFIDVVEALDVAHFSDADHKRPSRASVPPLGLSNKATADASITVDDPSSSTRPLEGELAAATLWPEVEKVFGHGYESITIATSNSHRLVATACKSTSPEHSVVRIWDTKTWQPFGEPLAGHSLTVTRIAFSPDDQFLLSVSRDRTWRLFRRDESTQYYSAVAADKSHSRIIWDCAWAHEGDVFVTASRDKTIKIWQSGTDGTWKVICKIKVAEAATAVDFSTVDKQNRRYLAIGLETGEILVYSNTVLTTDWQHQLTVDTGMAHVNHVHRLSWRPSPVEVTRKELASCSEDGTLKIVIVHMSMD